MHSSNTVLTDEYLKRKAPSVFALEAWQEQSDKYRFIPTIQVVNALRDAGYQPVSATQSNTRIEGKAEFTKHMLRFRSAFHLLRVNDIIPEIILINSHDGTSSYQMSLGLFRCVCSNQMVVADSQLETIRVRHSGNVDLCQNVIDVSARIIEEAPKTLDVAHRWNQLQLTNDEQLAFAASAKELYESSIDVTAGAFLTYRRYDDRASESKERSLWTTLNVIQENMIRGQIRGRNTRGRTMRTRAITSVDRDVKLNKALWSLAQHMEGLKRNQN